MKKEKILQYLGPEPQNLGPWMSMDNPDDLARAIILVDACFKDPQVLGLYDEGDRMSSSQTKHDRGHAFSVRDVGLALLAEYETRFPGALDPWTTKVVIPLALFLHDIGRALDVDNHAVAGASVVNVYLRRLRLPQPVIRRICRIIALHRSASVLRKEFDDPAWAIVVIADKCVGDEDRVRPTQANILKVLRFFRVAHRNWWEHAEHDRINFAIKKANLIVDSNEDAPVDSASLEPAGAIVLKLTLDEVVAPAMEVTTLYGDRFHSCGRAAQYLGFVFRLEFNGVRYMYDKNAASWRPVSGIQVPLP
ncbi:MAG: hypothetical protein ACRD3W_07810 [Terriglobales bacterium]